MEWAVVIAAAAFALSVINTAVGLFVVWWRRRAASFEMRLEQFSFSGP
jgi:hypothetical protein